MQEPEIDDELAALEANAPGARGATLESKAAELGIGQKLINAVLRKRTDKGTPSQGPSKPHPDQARLTRRAMARIGQRPDPRKQPHARMGRAKPGKSQAQINSEFRAAARAQLLKIKLTMILQHCPELKYIVEAEAPKARNVWWLSQLSTDAIRAIPNLGPKRRAAILKYLHEHQVPTTWVA